MGLYYIFLELLSSLMKKLEQLHEQSLPSCFVSCVSFSLTLAEFLCDRSSTILHHFIHDLFSDSIFCRHYMHVLIQARFDPRAIMAKTWWHIATYSICRE